MSRAELLVPDGWTPRRGSIVNVLATRDAPAPGGAWYVIDRAPGGWWVQPHDDDAKAWAARNPNALTMRCLEVAGRLLVPRGHTPRPPATPARRRAA